MHHTLVVPQEKRKNEAICLRPPHAMPITAPLADLVSPITPIRLSSGPRPSFTCTISDNICNRITSVGSNPGDSTIAIDTPEMVAELVCKKRKQIHIHGEEETRGWKKSRKDSNVLVPQTIPKELADIQCRKQTCSDMVCYAIGKESVTVSLSDVTQALRTQKIYPGLIEAIQQLEKTVSESRDHVPASISGPARTLKIKKNHQVLAEATWEIEKMLPKHGGSGYIIASEIVSRLSSSETVLLSCATVIDRKDLSSLANWQSFRNDQEEEAFCRKFSSSMPGSWDPKDIRESWENLHKVLIRCIHMWAIDVCERVRDGCDHLESHCKVGHRHIYCSCKKKAIRNRSGSVIRWDLVGITVSVDILPLPGN